jgi:hypothetical protein
MLLIERKENSVYEISYNKELICIFHDNIIDATYYFVKAVNPHNTTDLPKLINEVKYFVLNRKKVSNAS